MKKWLKITTGIILSLLLLVLLYFGSAIGVYLLKHRNDPVIEKETEAEIRAEVAKFPNVTIKNLVKWEGDTINEIEIADKGKISFWYRKGDAPRIEGLTLVSGQTYATSFQCEKNNNGRRSYAYTTDLKLTKDQPLYHLFNFEVKTIKDLITNFDKIYEVVKTFPKMPQTVKMQESGGTYELVASPDPKYSFHNKFQPESTCYYYIR
jgi:hypothetical protein